MPGVRHIVQVDSRHCDSCRILPSSELLLLPAPYRHYTYTLLSVCVCVVPFKTRAGAVRSNTRLHTAVSGHVECNRRHRHTTDTLTRELPLACARQISRTHRTTHTKQQVHDFFLSTLNDLDATTMFEQPHKRYYFYICARFKNHRFDCGCVR